MSAKERCAYAAKRSESASAPLASTVPTAGCSLSFLQHHLYLVSFVSSAASSLMVRHFLRHYFAVGVPRRNVRVIVQQGRAPASHAVAELLRGGVPIEHIRSDNQPYKETRRMQRVNEVVNSLPNASYVIHADVDELFVYPCWLQAQLAARRDEIFCAEMQDRLAAGGQITPLADASGRRF